MSPATTASVTLVPCFVAQKQVQLGKTIRHIPDSLMDSLAAYEWPGNVRELENVLERALILSDGPALAPDSVPLAPSRRARARLPYEGTLADVERAHILAVLGACGWKVSRAGNAAARLGLRRSTLQFRTKKLGIERPPGRAE